jgi:hypothetical protein
VPCGDPSNDGFNPAKRSVAFRISSFLTWSCIVTERCAEWMLMGHEAGRRSDLICRGEGHGRPSQRQEGSRTPCSDD